MLLGFFKKFHPMTSPSIIKPLRLKFWGTRGSYPVTSPKMAMFGGNTACVEVWLGEKRIIIDAGTGLIALGRQMLAHAPFKDDAVAKKRITILLSHLHHDHIQGLPFFAPVHRRDALLDLYCGNLPAGKARRALSAAFSPPLFPLSLPDMCAAIAVHDFRQGEPLALPHTGDAPLEIETAALDHPGGASAYRLTHQGKSLVYVSDTRHDAPRPAPRLIHLCRTADLVIYDTMFSKEQYERCQSWGHSTVDAGVLLCQEAGAKALAAFHHHPEHDDEALLRREAMLEAVLPGSFFAREGQEITFG